MGSNQPIYNENNELPIPREIVYDLVVFGGEPEGIAAATVAGEKGLKVLLVDERADIGGLMTLGGLNFVDMNYDKKGVLLTRGIFSRFYKAVEGNAFEIEKAKEVFKTLLLDAKVDVALNARLIQATVQEGEIKEIILEKDGERKTYQSRFFIDASTDGDLAALAGVPYTIFGEDIRKAHRLMGVTLVFQLENVNWPKVFTFLNYHRIQGKRAMDERQFYGAKLNTAWGYSIEGYQYLPQDENMRLRGLNVARQKDGSVLINALIIFDVNPLDQESKDLAIERGKKELEFVIPYINKHFAGFERATLKDTAKELYVRESRHFVTDYVLSIDDVLENKSFDDQIAIASYPVDVQPAEPGDFGTIIGNPDKYGIPYRSLLPRELKNLLLAGKHAGYSSLAAGSARVIPIGMVTAEASALATYVSIENQSNFSEISKDKDLFRILQEEIRKNNGYIDNFYVENPLEDKNSYEEMKNLRRMGLVAGGYHNEYYFDNVIDKWKFDHIMLGMLNYFGRADDYREIDLYPTFGSIGLLIYNIEKGNKEMVSEEELIEFLTETGINRKLMEKEWDYLTQPLVSDVYIIFSNYSNYLFGEDEGL